MNEEKPATVKFFCFSAAVPVFQILKYSGFGNIAYVIVLNSPTTPLISRLASTEESKS